MCIDLCWSIGEDPRANRLKTCCNSPSWPRHIVSEQVKEEAKKKLKPSPKRKAEADL